MMMSIYHMFAKLQVLENHIGVTITLKKFKMPLSDKLKFITIAHYNPHLPDCHLVHRWGAEETQRLVRRVLRFDKKVVFMGDLYGSGPTVRVWESEATEFSDSIRQWIVELEWEVHTVTTERMVDSAPPFLKTFVDKYSYRGFVSFVQSICHLYGARCYDDDDDANDDANDDAATDNRPLVGGCAARAIDIWTWFKVDSFLLLTLKRGLGMRVPCDSLVVPEGEWRYSSVTNDWGVLLDRYFYQIDRTLMITFESNICRYHGNDQHVIYRAVAAFHLQKMLRKRAYRQDRYKRLVRERVDLICYWGQQRIISNRRLHNYHKRFVSSTARMSSFFAYLLNTSNGGGRRQ